MDQYIQLLLTYVPFYVRLLHENNEMFPTKYVPDDIVKVEVVSIDKNEEDENDWGAGLHVYLEDGKHFMLYIPFYGTYLHNAVYECDEEIYQGIKVLEPDELPDITFPSNIFDKHHENESIIVL